ncbi:MAG: hypothetical protein ACQEQU_06665 [Spirochaetota bacterium]
MSFFAGVCYIWALVGIGSRIAMGVMGNRWKTWEVENAYSEGRPAWVSVVAVLGIGLIAFTWFKVFTSDVAHGWILAVLISLTGIKAVMFIFKYNQFREFVIKVLQDRKRFMTLNVVVVAFSAVLILMGIFLY